MPLEKRVLDIIIGIFLVIILLPFIIFVLLVMLVEGIFLRSSRGPIFYTETRISQGETFKLYKFRIFKTDVLNNRDFIETKRLEENKNNLTWAGKMLKQIYMDELPQLINVFHGEMSLVGPRPTNLKVSQKLFDEGSLSKFLIKAGVTGYYQSHKGNKFHADQEKLDMMYVDFCRNNPGWKIVLYDLKIILITIWSVLRAEGL